MKELAIIILDWNGADDTIECLKTLNNHSCYDIYLLDNGSSEDNCKIVSGFLSNSEYKDIAYETKVDSFVTGIKDITYIHSETNLGFAVGNNVVANRICDKYKYILLLNNDTEVPAGTIESMLTTAKERKAVALTCDIRVYYRKEELWNAGGYFTFLGERKYYSQRKIDKLKEQGVSFIKAPFITGCAMLVDSDYIKDNGLFTDHFFHGEEDFNFCYKLAQKNCIVGVDLTSVLYHKVGKSIQRAAASTNILNSMVVNYSNRVIDFKEFYSHFRWKVWRIVYLFVLYLRRVFTGMTPHLAFELCKRIYLISNKNDLTKNTFDEIMAMEWK